ncbi:MAG: helix-turn-helix domain-containing protein [Methylococcales bacterium]
MRFEEAVGGWRPRRLTQEEAARWLGVCERTFRRYLDRYDEAGLEGWNAKHFYTWYRRDGRTKRLSGNKSLQNRVEEIPADLGAANVGFGLLQQFFVEALR